MIGVDWIGVDLSMAVTYLFESVLKDVGDLGLTFGKALDLVLGPGDDFVWRDNFGLLEISGPAILTSLCNLLFQT